ncbi:MAG TPA: hypothetical protein VEH10_01670 [Thermoplasmata archaeon]|nr:hypothetical protein [Thermoplasmata archaeon]
MSSARQVRIARAPAAHRAPDADVTTPAAPPPGIDAGPTLERRENAGATHRAHRLALLYAVGIFAVYAALVAAARVAPGGASAGSNAELLLVGILALVLALAGVLVALGTAPRAVEFGARATVVVGRFGRRYAFPERGRLKTTVLQRTPAGRWSPVALELVEVAGGSTRRSFLIDEGLLGPAEDPTGPRT